MKFKKRRPVLNPLTANRKERKTLASAKRWFRLTPMFQGKDGATVAAGGQSYIIHTLPGDVVVTTLPADSCTLKMAQDSERELMAKMQRDVVVVSDNVRFFTLEELSRAEMAEMLKGSQP